jgi:spermidine/putrescine transport system substrate-binding protein
MGKKNTTPIFRASTCEDDLRPVSRREFLKRTSGAMMAVSASSAVFAASSSASSASTAGGSGSGTTPLASKTRPLTLAVKSANPPIGSGRAPEKGPLVVFDWADYLSPATVKNFEKRHGVSVEVTTFQSFNEAVNKLESGAIHPDIWTPGGSNIVAAVQGGLLQPLNHSYIPNLANLWPAASNPWYDQGSRYSVARNIQTFGFLWRNDLLHINPAAMHNPWDLVWDVKAGGKLGLSTGDPYDALYMAMLRRGVNILDTISKNDIARAVADLKPLVAAAAKWQYTAFQPIASGIETLAYTFNGDAVVVPKYLPAGTSPNVVSYYAPAAKGLGWTLADFWSIPKTARHPVLAHMWLNDFVTVDNGIVNFRDEGYQQPLEGLTVKRLQAAKAANARFIEMVYITKQELTAGIPAPLLTPQQTAWIAQAFAGLTA